MDEIRLDRLTKRFGDLVAVDHANLSIGQGEVMCLLGPSGCGKTTMLRMIAGLEWATSGDIWIGDKRVNDLPARDRNVAMTFQFYALYPSLSVEDNLAYPLHAENLSKDQIGERVAKVSEALDLKSILKRRPYQPVLARALLDRRGTCRSRRPCLQPRAAMHAWATSLVAH